MIKENYPKVYKNIENKRIILYKVRGNELPKVNVTLKRPYIDILVDSKYVNNIFSKLAVNFVVVVRNYSDKSIMDNLDVLKSVPLQKKDFIPQSVNDLYNIKYFKPQGQYGLGVSFDVHKCKGSKDQFKLHEELSFYDTKDLRDLTPHEGFENKASILIFSKTIKQSINSIFDKLEEIL